MKKIPTTDENGYLPDFDSHQSRKFPQSRKFTVDISEYHAITVAKKWLKTFIMKILFILVYKTRVNFCWPWPENTDNPEKNVFRVTETEKLYSALTSFHTACNSAQSPIGAWRGLAVKSRKYHEKRLYIPFSTIVWKFPQSVISPKI